MADRRTRQELLAENEALYAELEDIHNRLSEILEEDNPDGFDEATDDCSD